MTHDSLIAALHPMSCSLPGLFSGDRSGVMKAGVATCVPRSRFTFASDLKFVTFLNMPKVLLEILWVVLKI